MGKNQEERKTPVIVVKKRRTFSPPSLSEKTDIIAPVFTEQTAESAPAGINSSAVETHIPEAPARKKKKKRHRFPRPSHWTREYTHECVEKIKALFPHLRAEGGGFIPLKIGISNDISAFLAEHPETELTMDEWLCAVSCITSRRVYLQRTAVAGVPRYGLDGHPKGQVSDSEAQSAGRRLATLEQKWLRTQATAVRCRYTRRDVMQDTAQSHSSMVSSVSGCSARNAEISLLMPIFRGINPPPSARR